MKFISQNISFLMSKENLSQDEFGSMFGLKRGAIGSYLNKDVKPKIETLQKISEYFGLTIDDFLNVDISNSENIRSSAGIIQKNSSDKLPENNSRAPGIPLIPIEAMAGYVTGLDYDGVVLKNCDHYFVPEFQQIGADFMIRVSGDSMSPIYRNGDVLACKKIKEVLFFQWGKVYVLDTSQGALVKRLFEHEKPEYVVCRSDNKESYPPFALPRADIRGLSLVLGVIRIE